MRQTSEEVKTASFVSLAKLLFILASVRWKGELKAPETESIRGDRGGGVRPAVSQSLSP